jgi:hypothetical protein
MRTLVIVRAVEQVMRRVRHRAADSGGELPPRFMSIWATGLKSLDPKFAQMIARQLLMDTERSNTSDRRSDAEFGAAFLLMETSLLAGDHELADELANEWIPLAIESPHGPGSQRWVNAVEESTEGVRTTMSTDGAQRRARASVAGMVAASLVVGACTSGGSGQTGEVAAAQVTVVSPRPCTDVGCVGEGVDTATGSFQLAIEDLLLPPGLFGMELVRNYRSDAEHLGWFGRGWSTIYETTITEDGDNVTINAPAGLAPLWAPEAPAGWDVAGSPAIARVDGGYTLTWPTGELWTFGAAGLESLTSPYGATVTVERTSDTITLSSSQGVVLTATLTDDRVESIETNDGRQVDYRYVEDLLSALTLPVSSWHTGTTPMGA